MVEEPSLVDELLDNPMIPAAAGGLIALLAGYHFYCWRLLKDFAADRNRRSHVWYRWFNEVPVLFLIAIVLLASVKPF